MPQAPASPSPAEAIAEAKAKAKEAAAKAAAVKEEMMISSPALRGFELDFSLKQIRDNLSSDPIAGRASVLERCSA